MAICPLGIDLIKHYEALRLKAYHDTGGVLTIGYGHVIRPGDNIPPKIDEEAADMLLRHDLEDAEKAIDRLVRVPLEPHEYSALVSFVFNVGEGQFQQSSMLSLIKANKKKRAVGEFGRWVFDNSIPYDGLIKRRASEAMLFNSGKLVLL